MRTAIRTTAVAVAACSLGLAGCRTTGEAEPAAVDRSSNNTAPSREQTSESGAATPTAGPGPDTNNRGYIEMSMGDSAGVGPGHDSPDSSTFSIESVEVDPPCVSHGSPPVSGHTLLLHITVSTGDDPTIASKLDRIVNPFSFSEVADGGIVDDGGLPRNLEWGICTDPDDKLDTNYGPNQEYEGTVEVIVPHASGTLFQHTAMANAKGWEWSY